MAHVLVNDDTLYCVSAWNDNGFPGQGSDEARFFRTTDFPGLGWMLRRDAWERAHAKWPQFPTTGWDHWMRLPPTQGGRECIYPEVSRTHHIAKKGTNVNEQVQKKIYDRMLLASYAPRSFGNLTATLSRTAYDDASAREISEAVLVQRYEEAFALANSLQHQGKAFLVPYVRDQFKRIAEQNGLFGMPRGQHDGIMRAVIGGRTIFFADRYRAQLLPTDARILPAPNISFIAAAQGRNCIETCSSIGKVCDDKQQEFANNCETMASLFPCEAGCGHQMGAELPAYVPDPSVATFQQCLIFTEGAASCKSAHKSTARACACLPRR